MSTVQRALGRLGYSLRTDGKFGPETERAVRAFQRDRGLEVDGKVGPQTLGALRDGVGGSRPRAGGAAGSGATGATGAAEPGTPARGAPANRTAVFDSYRNQGQRNQLANGRITVNGNTYNFRTGGYGKGSLPKGSYDISAHRWNRNDPSMSVGGVGYSVAMSDKYDRRVGATRTELRIHPDGGTPGTLGCMGIVGDAATQRRFREDIRAELARAGGRFTLNVQ